MLDISRLPGLSCRFPLDPPAPNLSGVSPTLFPVRAHLVEPRDTWSLLGWILRLQIPQLFYCRDYFCSWVGLNFPSAVNGHSAVRQFFAQLPSPACERFFPHSVSYIDIKPHCAKYSVHPGTCMLFVIDKYQYYHH